MFHDYDPSDDDDDDAGENWGELFFDQALNRATWVLLVCVCVCVCVCVVGETKFKDVNCVF